MHRPTSTRCSNGRVILREGKKSEGNVWPLFWARAERGFESKRIAAGARCYVTRAGLHPALPPFSVHPLTEKGGVF